MICSNCGNENPAGRRFCDNCGRPLASACPSCGEQNRPDARFCGNCGTELADGEQSSQPSQTQPAGTPPDVAERRLVSVLFADLVGFTPFAEERDPEEVRDILSRYFDSARAVVERHGGTVEKFIGDAVMAVWGTPIAREDDAERAVRAALELLPAVRGVDERLQARAGVLTGEAAVSLSAAAQGMVAGDLVNTAARLQSVASPGAVLVGESTMRAASAAVAFERAGEHELKGKANALPAWRALRVIAERGGRSRSDTLEPPFVGRDAELALLKDLLHATTREGRPRLVAITGPGGIGKSRLAWELEKYVDGLIENVYWHRGRSPSYGEGISFWALGEMVRRRAGLAEGDDESTTRQRIAATVADYVGDDEDRRWVEPALLTLLGVEPPPPGGRDVLFAAWRIFFERIAARGTTVMLFEDLQFADSGLLDFIDHLVEWSKGAPIVVLALARPELFERRPELGRAARQFHSVPLEPLGEEHMRELLTGLVPDLDERATRSIVARADGIPLYAVETVRMLIADGYLEGCDDGSCRVLRELGELAVPDTLRSLIASRLDALEPADRLLLQQASVLGGSFTPESLAAISAVGADDLAGRLRSMVRRELLAVEADPRSPDKGQYRFVQGLIREVAYGTLARRERRERHLAAARHFEAVGDEETAGALASHYLAAYEASEHGPEADAVATQARLALRGAAERAASLGAYGLALTHLEQALTITSDDNERAELLERAAHAAESDARYEKGMEVARQALETYVRLGDRHGAGRLSALLGALYVDASRHGEGIEVFETALAELPEDAVELEATLAARLSRAYMRKGQYGKAIAAADRALDVAERQAMEAIIAEALVNKGTALGNSGRWREGAALIGAAIPLAEQAGAGELHLRALNNLASTVAEDDPARALEITTDGLAIARRLGLRGMVNWLVGTIAGFRHWLGRDWDLALAELEEAAQEAGNASDRARLGAYRLSILAERGEATRAELDRVLELAESVDDPSFRAGLYSLEGDLLRAAGDDVGALAAYARAAGLGSPEGGALMAMLRSACWLGDRAGVVTACELLEGYPSSARIVTVGRAWGRAVLAAMDGRTEEAMAGFREAIMAGREMGVGFEVARMAVDAAIVLPGEPEVEQWAREARATFERLKARVYLERLDVAEARAGRPPAEAVARPSADARTAVSQPE